VKNALSGLTIEEKIQGLRRHLVWGMYERQLLDLVGDQLESFQDIFKWQHYWCDAAFKPGELMASIREHLIAFRGLLKESATWEATTLGELLIEYCLTAEVEPHFLTQALKLATTGITDECDVFAGMCLLGKERTLERIDQTLCITPQTTPEDC
tara:strand:+ start:1695 stop:2156 length:462 start_codon:yes stop_codon:yes gene_type:complete